MEFLIPPYYLALPAGENGCHLKRTHSMEVLFVWTGTLCNVLSEDLKMVENDGV